MTESSVSSSKRESSWEFLRTMVYAIVLAVIFRSFAYEPFHIPSASMENTLLIGDYIFVSKWSYGYSRYSFPLGFPPFEGRIFFHAPERGDVVVFRPPGAPQVDYIKRIIGLPGDRIQVQDGVVILNGKPIPRRRVEDYVDVRNGTDIVHIPRYEETLPSGRTYFVLDETRFGEKDNTEVYTVPQAHYFMMGDNRDNSRDSRFMDGIVDYVPEANLIGKARLIAFSLDGTSLRLSRFFTRIP